MLINITNMIFIYYIYIYIYIYIYEITLIPKLNIALIFVIIFAIHNICINGFKDSLFKIGHVEKSPLI